MTFNRAAKAAPVLHLREEKGSTLAELLRGRPATPLGVFRPPCRVQVSKELQEPDHFSQSFSQEQVMQAWEAYEQHRDVLDSCNSFEDVEHVAGHRPSSASRARPASAGSQRGRQRPSAEREEALPRPARASTPVGRPASAGERPPSAGPRPASAASRPASAGRLQRPPVPRRPPSAGPQPRARRNTVAFAGSREASAGPVDDAPQQSRHTAPQKVPTFNAPRPPYATHVPYMPARRPSSLRAGGVPCSAHARMMQGYHENNRARNLIRMRSQGPTCLPMH
eukprot:CAMPEP_0170581934 /NCGR_PEP_ID=MMETSP0224-20130122/7310_1 /TAXON_ID=285029 /ORGANISM="Togula jolla, Strain CCCM 725" /LENGTH=280 /DNA_ID=CAMNT_0010905115 /DNA_START=45 /DNA_END=887 /DNA_ORIENTATION=-